MPLEEHRRKWEARYQEAEPPAAPAPHPLALRWRRRMAGGRMLDAACGLGRGIAAAAHVFHTVYAVDFSLAAVSQARRIWAGRPIHWIVGDVTTLRWPADFFGLVCAFGFTDLPFFARIRESIRPGGMFLYEGFSPRQLKVKPDLNPAWISTPADWERLLDGWEVLEQGESAEPPYRTRYAALRPAFR